jgi:hypothetical protein
MLRLPRNSKEFNTNPNRGIDLILEYIRRVSNLDQVTSSGNTTTNTIDVGGVKSDYFLLDTTATPTLEVGMFAWNDADGTADLRLKGNNVTLQIGQEEVIRIVNKTGSDLLEANFQAVRVRLVSEGGAQGQRLAVVLAQADSDINSATAIGIVTETIANNQEGFITVSGNVRGIDTTGAKSYGGLETWLDGDILYLDPNHAGYLTNVKPLTPGHLIVMGYVVYAHQNQGKIFVKVDNGYELEEIHDVLVTSVADEDILRWNASGPYWENVPASTYSDKTYVHVQGTPSSTWNVAHNLSKYPSVTIVDSGNNVVIGEIAYTDDNNLVVTFGASFSGKAYVN